MFVYALAGPAPWAFHLVNVLFHSAASVMAYLLARRIFERAGINSGTPALFTGLIFAAHPIHTEAVNWAASFPELSFTLFYFLSVYCYLGGNSTSGKGRKLELSASVLSFVLAALSKETGLTLPGAIMAADLAFSKKPFRTRLRGYIPFAAVSAVYLAVRLYLVRVTSVDLGLTNAQVFLNALVNLSMYFEKLVLPLGLNAYYVFHPVYAFTQPKSLIAFVIIVAVIGALLISFHKRKVSFLGLAFIVLPIIPALYLPVFPYGSTFAERYLYLPCFGFALILTDLAFIQKRYLKPATVILSILVALYCVGVITRNPVWKDQFTLAKRTVGQSPDSAVMRVELGVALQNKGMLDEAIQQYLTAINLDPRRLEPFYNIGTCYEAKGQTGEAIGWFKKTLEKNPDYMNAHEQLGSIYMRKWLLDQAINEFSIVLKANPEQASAHNNLGLALLRKGRYDEASQEFRTASMLEGKK